MRCVDAYPCVPLRCVLVSGGQEFPDFLVINLCVSRINATQGLASLCEPALRRHFKARDKFMRISQNWPLGKFMRFLFICYIYNYTNVRRLKFNALQIYATGA